MKDNIIAISPNLLIIALVGEFIVTFILGSYYEGYSHIGMVMSELGSSNSPVAFWMSLYWVFYGISVILFGYGFHQKYRNRSMGRIIGCFFILIGFGNGLGSAFPMDSAGADVTLLGTLHNIGSGIGFLSMFAIPFILFKFLNGNHHKKIRICLFLIQVFIITQTAFFLIMAPGSDTGMSIYVGLWQRLYITSYYSIFTVLALTMKDAEMDSPLKKIQNHT